MLISSVALLWAGDVGLTFTFRTWLSRYSPHRSECVSYYKKCRSGMNPDKQGVCPQTAEAAIDGTCKALFLIIDDLDT